MIKKILIAMALLATGDAVRAQAPCAVDPQARDAAECELAGWMSAFGQMNGQLLDAIEILRALASSNPQFERAESQLTEAQQQWRVRIIADCEARSAGLMVAATKASRFMACDTSRTSDRVEALRRYVAELKAVQAAPGTNPPVAPTFRCPFSDPELASVTVRDACMIKAAAKRCDNDGDVCLVRCLATGGAKQIGGGCYHVCRRHGLRGTPWVAPAEAAACTTK